MDRKTSLSSASTFYTDVSFLNEFTKWPCVFVFVLASLYTPICVSRSKNLVFQFSSFTRVLAIRTCDLKTMGFYEVQVPQVLHSSNPVLIAFQSN